VTTYTAAEVAEEFRCSKRKITDTATKNRIGADLDGRAGFRFTEADKDALWNAMRPEAPVAHRRRRRSA
jgi:hypothetical protein